MEIVGKREQEWKILLQFGIWIIHDYTSHSRFDADANCEAGKWQYI